MTSCQHAANVVTGVTIRDRASGTVRSYSAAVVIDATELGDLMPLCGVRYRLGAGTSPNINPSDRLQDITWTAVLRRYDGDIPERLRITLAVAGFRRSDLEITLEDNKLTIRGHQQDEGERDYLYRGIAARQFQRTFVLAEGIEVRKADLDNGLLAIDLVRHEPERTLRRITIGDAPKGGV